MRSHRSSDLRQALGRFCGTVSRDHPLRSASHLRTGGPAEWFVEPATETDLIRAVRVCRDLELPLYMLGGGSNLLIADRGVRGVVMSSSALDRVSFAGTWVSAGAGVSLPALLRLAKDRGLAGLETLAGIPAMVGGAVAMNAGTRQGETFDHLVALTVVDPTGELRVLDRSELRPSYRDGGIGGSIVVGATFDLTEDRPEAIRARFTDYLRARNATQPVADKSLGCVFRNPRSVSAGRLIEAAGCKSLRQGAMAVSGRHANFFVNGGGGTSRQFLNLVDRVRDRVLGHCGVELHPEFRTWGF